MAAAPDFNAFGGGAAPVAAQPVGAPPANPPPMVAPIPAPPPVTRGGGGGGKGLIIGLGAIGAVLLIGIVVVAATQLKPDDDEDQPLTNPFGSSSGQTTIAPQVDTGTAPTGSTETPAAEDGGKPTPTATATRTSTAPTATATSTANAAQACDQCNTAARSGAIQAAAAAYRRCNDALKKANCSAQASRSAPGAARTAALNGNCAQAKGIIGAANAMGAGSGGLNNALRGTKCQ
jgi:hypothetical protein